MENIFLESYDVFKTCSANAGKFYNNFLKNNKKYQITRCYYIIIVDNVFLTYSHLMLYEECLYLLFSQNKLNNGNFTLKIKKAELAKKFKTDITKSATETIKRLYELYEVKISILVKDKIEKQMNIIEFISVPKTDKYSDLENEITIKLNSEFVRLYRCNYIDKIEYLNEFSQEQGSFIRYFMQHDLDSGVKSSAILDKMGVFNYIPFSRKKRFEQEIANIEFYYKNEKYKEKDGFIISDTKTTKSSENKNTAIAFYEMICKKIKQQLTRQITLNNEDLNAYYEKFNNLDDANSIFRILTNIELMLNNSLNKNKSDIFSFSRFFDSVVCTNKDCFKIYIEVSLSGFEYILSKKANLDIYDVESSDYGLTTYPLSACSI